MQSISVIIFTATKALVPVIVEEIDKHIQDVPDDPGYRGDLAKKILQSTVMMILNGMLADKKDSASVVRDFAYELINLNKGYNYDN